MTLGFVGIAARRKSAIACLHQLREVVMRRPVSTLRAIACIDRPIRALGMFALALTGAGLALSRPEHAGAAARTTIDAPVVLELFTSQGCNSCPPADALLERYTSRPDVIALSLPVDYWDNLGWKDTFGSRAHSQRQREYALARGDGQVYTPQVVVGGLFHAVGSSSHAIDNAVAAVRARADIQRFPVQLVVQGNEVVISVGASSDAAGSSVLLAAVQDHGTVDIRRGENSGRSITYHNVVRSLQRVATLDGRTQEIRVPLDKVKATGASALVALVQKSPGGAILGAAMKPGVWTGS